MSEMPLVKFIVYTVLGSTIWNTTLVCVGAFAGDKKDYILSLLNEASHIVVILLIITFLGIVFWFYKIRSKKRK